MFNNIYYFLLMYIALLHCIHCIPFLMSNIIYINFLLHYNIIILINNNLILFYKLYMII